MNTVVKIISQEELRNIESLENIGAGACANLYKSSTDVYKLLKENAKGLYREGSLEKLAEIENSLCIFPNKILKDDEGKYLGYAMDFVPGEKMKDVFSDLSFEQLQQAIADAELGIEELSEHNIVFDDMHFDNIMWDYEQESIKIIDTDFFKFAEDFPVEEIKKSNLSKFNNQIETLIGIRDGVLAKYLNRNAEYTQFYKQRFKRGLMGEKLSSYELIDKIKTIAEKDFGTEFTCMSEIIEKVQSKAKEYEDEELDIENWSEGNEHLRTLLRSCRDNNVPSMYCCAGHENKKTAYITVQMNEQTMGKIYNIMSQLSDFKDIGFRFAQKEFGKDPSFTIYMLKEKSKNEIMDIISEAMTQEQQRDKLPENFQALTKISNIFVNEEIGFDLVYDILKNNNRLVLANLRFGNSHYIEPSDFKKMGLKIRKDMFGNTQYFRNRINHKKENTVLRNISKSLSNIYDMEFEKPEELSFGQETFKKASNKILNKLPFINKLVNKHKLLPKANPEISSGKAQKKAFINKVSNNGEYRKLSETDPSSLNKNTEQLDNQITTETKKGEPR